MAFFDQKRGLTPLDKCNFLDFETKVSLFPAKSENIISSLILIKFK